MDYGDWITLSAVLVALGLGVSSLIRTQRLERKEYRLRLLENILEWLGQIEETVDENIYDPEKWSSYETYYKSKPVLLKKLLHLSGVGFYHRIPANIAFKKYKFEQIALDYMESFGKYTDKLHDAAENPLDEDFMKDYGDYEVEFENKTSDFHKFVMDIFIKEQRTVSR